MPFTQMSSGRRKATSGRGWFGIASLVAWSITACGGTSTPSSTCSYDGREYAAGDRFPSNDGCNSCSCDDQGRVACTLLACETCESVASRYGTALDDATRCDPSGPGQCSKLIGVGLACGCEAFVNQDKVDAIAAAQSAQERYASMSCGGDVQCGPCAVPSSGFCSAQGKCESLTEGSEPACKVSGVVYKSGSTGIADPVSCNSCDCQAGQLGCTEIACPKPCPASTTYAEQCALCGPTDACLVVEHACLPSCADACAQGSCIAGVCRMVCG